MKVFYDKKPEPIRKIGDGRCVYCYDIKEHIQEGEEMGTAKTWECEQVEVYEPLSQNKILSAVISDRWDNDFEQKLLNEYMSTQMGIYGTAKSAGAESQKKVERYQDFLRERNEIKNIVDKDCKNYGIE